MSIELLVTSFFLCSLPLLFFLVFVKTNKAKQSSPTSNYLPKPYPIFGHHFQLASNRHRMVEWITSILQNTPSATCKTHPLYGADTIWTANPANVQHILKTQFGIYTKGIDLHNAFFDVLGDGIFNVDGKSWKFQRQISIHEFSTKSLRKFVEVAVENELTERLVPFLSAAAANKDVIDFQDVLQRFTFDNICKIAFGYDSAYLLPSLPQTEFAKALDEALMMSAMRIGRFSSLIWKTKRLLSIGSEKRLKLAASKVHEFAKNIIREKKQELKAAKPSAESMDLLSRFLSSGQYDDNFVRDIVISFALAGRDTTSAALTWFFWLLSKNPEVEKQILIETEGISDNPDFADIKEMVYTQAALCESMRLYPPLPLDSKKAEKDDVLPDGTVVRKGMAVMYHPYAMGRMESIWGCDWEEFKPERWLKKVEGEDKWSFEGKDPYTYPVFQAGPRICLGKEMAFLQMKRVVSGVLRRFKVVPAMEDGFQPHYVAYLSSKMAGGFPVRIEKRTHN